MPTRGDPVPRPAGWPLAGELPAAIASLEEVTVATEQLLGENNPRTCMALEALSKACRQANRWADAIQAHEKILQICLNTLGDDSPFTHRITEEIADLHDRDNAQTPLVYAYVAPFILMASQTKCLVVD